jgi:hypothetical protein
MLNLGVQVLMTLIQTCALLVETSKNQIVPWIRHAKTSIFMPKL